jgi:trimethylamine-N-oxide reductase (cytochrome c)
MTDISRRGFMKCVGTLAGAFAFGSLLPYSAWASSLGRSIQTANHWGAMTVEVKDGKIISSTGVLQKSIANDLQTTAPDMAHTKARVKYPMVRKGFLANPGVHDGKRGDDEFVRVSWEKALKLIHEQEQRIRKENGPEAVYAGSYGWRSSGCAA